MNIKSCSDGNKSRETNEIVRDIANDMDTTKQDVKTLTVDADTIKAFSKATNNVVQRIEEKTEIIEETTDSILAKLDSCCGCNKKNAKKTVKKTVARQTNKENKTSTQQVSDTLHVTVYDTIKVEKPQEKPAAKKTKAVIRCLTPEEWAEYYNKNRMYE